MIRVLMVCMGNICRSPMAEAVFRHEVNRAGLSDQIAVASAGTLGAHAGEPAHHGTLAILKRNKIQHNGCARKIRPEDLDDFDYLLAMDTENLNGIYRLRSRLPQVITEPTHESAAPEIGLFLRYANDAGLTNKREVPDPYYDGRFEQVYELVCKGSTALLAHIRQTHGI
jgi:protein-tyrosine phosphatase